MCEPKAGTLVGTDYTGNKYFENNREQAGRNRWVDYAQVSRVGWLRSRRLDRRVGRSTVLGSKKMSADG